MKPRSAALLTDFGLQDPFVGVIKGVILSRSKAPVLDLTHGIPAHDVRTAAFQLASSVPFFPAATLFVCVVDPGVGSEREIVWARTSDHQFLAPDNGLLSWVERRSPFLEVRSVSNSKLFLSPLSSTFHGRDIFAPVAGALLAGLAPAALGPARKLRVRLPFPEPRRGPDGWRGEILAVDRFGNAVTNLTPDHARSPASFIVRRHRIPAAATYARVARGRALAVLGSSGTYELSVREGSFARAFHAKPGDPVTVSAA